MDESDGPKIKASLDESSAAGLSFEAAKQKLAAAGYSEQAINQAADNYQYGQKQVADDGSAQVTSYLEAHPEQAEADGEAMLQAKAKDDAKETRMRAGLDAMAAEASPDLQSEVHYDYRFAQDTGIPFWALLVVGLVVDVGTAAIVTILKIPRWYYAINGIISLAVIVLLVKHAK